METRHRHRPYLVHIARYKKTGHYFVVITTAQSINLDTIIKRIHDAMAAGPKRAIINFPLKDFADTYSPVVPDDFEVLTMVDSFGTHKEAAKLAREMAQTEHGTKLLLSTQIVDRALWEAYVPAKENVIRRQCEAANVASLSAPSIALQWFSEHNRSCVETGIVNSKQGVDGSLTIWASNTTMTLLTPNIEEQTAKCVAAEKIVMISIYVELVFKDTRRFHSGNVMKHIKFSHFAPSLQDAILELKDLVADVLVTHTGDSAYPTCNY
ncbi:hypothetical protein D3C85_270400 [compost metagenome]